LDINIVGQTLSWLCFYIYFLSTFSFWPLGDKTVINVKPEHEVNFVFWLFKLASQSAYRIR